MTFRTDWYKGVIASVLTAAMVVVYPASVHAIPPGHVVLPSTCLECQAVQTGPEMRVSRAITEGVVRELSNVRARYQSGNIRSEDVQALMTSSRIYFAHLEEVGFNSMMDAKFKDPAFQKQVLELTLDDAQAGTLSRRLSDQGTLSISKDEVKARFSRSYEVRKRALDEIQRVGVAAVQERILQSLSNLQVRIADKSTSGAKKLNASLVGNAMNSAFCSSGCPEVDLCGWLELMAIGFAAGCLFGCAPCCGAALAAEIYAWLCEHGLLIF